MKILQVVHGFPPAQRYGTQIYTYHLSKELAKKHEVHVLYPTLGDVKKPALASFVREGLNLHELRLPRGDRLRSFWDRFSLRSTYVNRKVEDFFRILVKDLRPDVIHFQHLIGLSATLIEIARELNIPTIITLHDYWFMCPNIQLLKHDYTVCKGPQANKCRECWIKRQTDILAESLSRHHIPKTLTKTLVELFLRVSNRPGEFVRRQSYFKRLLSTVDKIIAPSRFLREVFIRYGVPEDKIVYSENGYDLSVFRGFQKKNKDGDKIVFGFAGSVAKHKGVHVLVDAFMNVPEDRAELRIYGNYDPKSRYVRELLEKVRSKKNIKFMGRFEDVKDPYSEIDVLVFPSICYENCPLVLAEARATKTPVIASNLGAIPEFIEDSKTGLLFEPNNPVDLQEKIMLIIENPELVEKFKANIKPPKTIEEQAKEIEEIYKNLATNYGEG